MGRQNKESANFKIGLLRLPSLRSRKKKKRTEPNRAMSQHEACQHMYNGSFRRSMGKGAERIFEVIMAKNFANLIKNMNAYIQESQ